MMCSGGSGGLGKFFFQEGFVPKRVNGFSDGRVETPKEAMHDRTVN